MANIEIARILYSILILTHAFDVAIYPSLRTVTREYLANAEYGQQNDLLLHFGRSMDVTRGQRHKQAVFYLLAEASYEIDIKIFILYSYCKILLHYSRERCHKSSCS